jgi:hypothetical protein
LVLSPVKVLLVVPLLVVLPEVLLVVLLLQHFLPQRAIPLADFHLVVLLLCSVMVQQLVRQVIWPYL